MRLAVICMVLALLAPRAAGDPKPKRTLVVVVAKTSKVTSLSRTELRRCFTGESVEVGDQRLAPFNYSPGMAERVAFDRAILDMSSDEVGRFWVDRKIRGQSQPPRAVGSAMYIQKLVARFPGAIGYLPSDQITPDLKVIPIDGVKSIDW